MSYNIRVVHRADLGSAIGIVYRSLYVTYYKSEGERDRRNEQPTYGTRFQVSVTRASQYNIYDSRIHRIWAPVTSAIGHALGSTRNHINWTVPGRATRAIDTWPGASRQTLSSAAAAERYTTIIIIIPSSKSYEFPVCTSHKSRCFSSSADNVRDRRCLYV